MKKETEFFENCPEKWRDGYLIYVRNRLNNMLEREYISRDMKKAYIEAFGENIIYEDDFISWYCSIREQ